MSSMPTHRRLNSALKNHEVRGTGAQTRYQLQEQKGAKKFFKIAGITTLTGLVAVAGLYTALHVIKGQKEQAVNQVAAQEQTLEQTAKDYVSKAQDMMKEGNVSRAIDFVIKAEGLEVGTQYAPIASDLSKAKELKDSYDERNDKVKALISEQNYDLALKVLNQDNKYDSERDITVYSQKVLAKKLAEIGVIVSEHDELEGKINHFVLVRNEKRALTGQAASLSKKLKATQREMTIDDATLGGDVDSAISISYRVSPSSEDEGGYVRILTKKGDKMVLKDEQQKFLYNIAVKLENILPDTYFGPSQLSQLFQSGELTSLKIEEIGNAFTLTLMGKDRKEIQKKIDPKYASQVSDIYKSIMDHGKGAEK